MVVHNSVTDSLWFRWFRHYFWTCWAAIPTCCTHFVMYFHDVHSNCRLWMDVRSLSEQADWIVHPASFFQLISHKFLLCKVYIYHVAPVLFLVINITLSSCFVSGPSPLSCFLSYFWSMVLLCWCPSQHLLPILSYLFLFCDCRKMKPILLLFTRTQHVFKEKKVLSLPWIFEPLNQLGADVYVVDPIFHIRPYISPWCH